MVFSSDMRTLICFKYIQAYAFVRDDNELFFWGGGILIFVCLGGFVWGGGRGLGGAIFPVISQFFVNTLM